MHDPVEMSSIQQGGRSANNLALTQRRRGGKRRPPRSHSIPFHSIPSHSRRTICFPRTPIKTAARRGRTVERGRAPPDKLRAKSERGTTRERTRKEILHCRFWGLSQSDSISLYQMKKPTESRNRFESLSLKAMIDDQGHVTHLHIPLQ